MLHGHEDSVKDNADCDAKIDKWVHDKEVEALFDPKPTAAAVPLQKDVGEGIPTWRTGSLIVLKV